VQAAQFYLEKHPFLLNDLLIRIALLLDHEHLIGAFGFEWHIGLVLKYLLHVQRTENVFVVNEVCL